MDLPASLDLAREAATRLGYDFALIDEEHKHLWALNGRPMLGARSPLNDSVGARLAQDKYYTALLLDRAGYPVPEFERCLAPGTFEGEAFQRVTGLDHARAFMDRLGGPVMVKPNQGSMGRGVVRADDVAALEAALNAVWEKEPLALLQRPVTGPDLRIDLLDGELLLAYTRAPVVVVGDGTRTIRELVGAHGGRFTRDDVLESLAGEPRLVARGLTPDAVLPEGESLPLADTVLNLNQWSVGTLVESLPERWRARATEVGRTLGLRHYGIDFKGAGPEDDPDEAWVIEVNASPLLLQMRNLGHEEAAVGAQMKILEAVVQSSTF